MPTPYETPLGSWTHSTTFFWAALGATFGLANVWQFPYLAGQHGGGLFVLLYLACLLLITLPLMVTEATMGRYARHGIVLAMDGFIRSARCSRWWMWAGRLGVLAAFLVLSFTAVFGAIALAYVFFGAMGRFFGADQAKAAGILANLVSSPDEYRAFMAWHAFFLLLVIWVSMQGVVRGLERAIRAVAPAMLVLLATFIGLAAWRGDFSQSMTVLLSFDRDALSFESVKAALFHAFFTLGLGMGVWTLFGAYTPSGTRLKRSILAVVLMDTLIAIGAGLAIYSLVPGGQPMDGERGFGLLFISLPVAVADMPGSQFLLAAIFLLMVMVVWTTSLALLEPVVGWFREWTGTPRELSVVIISFLAWLVGLGSLWSFNVWSDVQFAGGTFFRWLEMIAGGLLVPTVSILLSVFAGWYLTRTLALRVLGSTPRLFGQIWFTAMRLVLPVVVAYIGLQYTASGIMGMCDRASDVFWCSTSEEAGGEAGRVQRDASSPDSDEAAEPRQGSTSKSSESPDKETGNDNGDVDNPAPQENPPDNEEILFHSA